MGSFNPGQGQVHLPAIPSVHTTAQQRLVSPYPSYFHNVCVPPGQAAVRPFQPPPCPGQPPFLSTPSMLAPVQHRLVYHHPADFHCTGTPLSQGEARSLLPPPIPNHTHETQPICAGIYQIPKREEQTDTPAQHVSPSDFYNADASPVQAEAWPFHYPLFQNHTHGDNRICAGIHQIPELEEQTDPPAQHVSHTDFHNTDASPVQAEAKPFHSPSFPTYTHEEDQICAGIRQIPKHNEQTESSDEEIPSPGTIGGIEIRDKSTTIPWELTESGNNSTQNHSTRRCPSRTENHQQLSHADIIISQLNALKGTEIKVKTSYCEPDCRNHHAIFKIPGSRYHIEVSFDYDFEKGMRYRNVSPPLYIKGRLEFDEVGMKQYVRAKSEKELTTWPSQRSHYIPLFLESESIQIVHRSDNRAYSATAPRYQRPYSKHQK